jgi:D-3-phosphoglycerate dehydrogenase
MQVSRDAKGGQALVGMTVDSAVPADVLARILTEIGADFGRAVDLDEPAAR